MNETMRLGVCYYPEHWPEEYWDDDASRMAAMGLSRVRIGEFAWSRIEPAAGNFVWDWLDRAVDTLYRHGLGIIIGTPTATPPKWLVDQMPDMLAIDEQGRTRKFGSRRHYCFSHMGYRQAASRIVAAMAERYGSHPAIVAWQTDNEYGCHDTVLSHTAAAREGFRLYLANRYSSIEALNAAWGNVFWSMEYQTFDAIDLPNLCVTEPNPAHVLDFRRFSSDQVVRFNRMQCDILRIHSPGRDIVHNFMGFYTEFDHHAVGRDLDVATWDSYPLGFLEQFWFSEEEKNTYCRQGHPDIAAFHHDLYRGCAQHGRWWVMEQQPGPVNWARFNPAPLPGMVRLWTLEAMAHGAELVSYFRWRQAPFAQEQMHAGLLRPDRVDDVGAHEARQTAGEIAAIGAVGAPPKSVALIFSYESDWVTEIQPQGRNFSALRLTFEFYSALRQLGLDIDILPPDAAIDGYNMVVIPTLPILPDGLVDRLAAFNGPILIGPRTGSKTASFSIPSELPPGALQRLIPIKVTRVESLREGVFEQGDGFVVKHWLEHVETQLPAEVHLQNGQGVVYANGAVRYIAAWPDTALLKKFVQKMAEEAGLETIDLEGQAIRIRRTGDLCFTFNYGAEPSELKFGADADFILGSRLLEPADVAIWRKHCANAITH
jgi:beta-galactosidase